MNAGRWCGKVGALIAKEAKQMARDPSTWMVAFLLPCLFLFFFGYAISLDVDSLRVAVLKESGGAQGADIRLSFVQSPHFQVIPAATRQEAHQLMADSEVHAVVILPGNFDAELLGGRGAAVQVQVDGSEPNTATFIRAYIQELVRVWQRQQLRAAGYVPVEEPMRLEPVYWFNDATRSRWALIPGSITVVMTLIGTLLTSLVLTREWERGTMEVLLSSPISRMQLFISKLVPYYLLGMGSMVLCSLVGVWGFQVPFRGSCIALLALSTTFLLPALGQGLFISSLCRSQLPAAIAGFMTSVLPAFVLSGLLFDIHSMPWGVRLVTKILPSSYLNVSLQTLFLAGDIWPLFLRHMGCMAGLGLIFCGLAYRNMARTLD